MTRKPSQSRQQQAAQGYNQNQGYQQQKADAWTLGQLGGGQ